MRDHAARLREMAEQEKGMATVLPAGTMHSLCLSDAATFIAGAEALERVERDRCRKKKLYLLAVGCKQHPAYRYKRAPRECEVCQSLYLYMQEINEESTYTEGA